MEEAPSVNKRGLIALAAAVLMAAALWLSVSAALGGSSPGGSPDPARSDASTPSWFLGTGDGQGRGGSDDGDCPNKDGGGQQAPQGSSSSTSV